MSPENCPQCGKKLAPPFKSSGRQVCSGCGWTNKPKIVKPEAVSKFIPISESEESKKQPVGVFLATGFVGMVLFAIIAPNIMAGGIFPRERESEGKNYIGVLARAQQVYRFENDKFTYSIYELDISLDPTYYEISIIEANESKAIILAKSLEKKHKIKSFAEGISYDNDSEQFEKISCETKKYSTDINPPALNDSGWSCGSGSIERE
ncbi:MAG: type IV pilin-like G/H family protein [Pleurocapsa minor HA4230-MV1]|jgi:hypothetical protein|nr:type IV pilin-like G/H family protein [Pleurocapsa minor HA4230-MV1]